MGSSTQAGTGCTDLQLIGSIVVDCQALTWRIALNGDAVFALFYAVELPK